MLYHWTKRYGDLANSSAIFSTKFCRPIRIGFVIILAEINYISNHAENFVYWYFEIEMYGENKLQFSSPTMVDGCNAVISTSSTMKCYVCGLKSKDFNKFDIKQPKTSNQWNSNPTLEYDSFNHNCTWFTKYQSKSGKSELKKKTQQIQKNHTRSLQKRNSTTGSYYKARLWQYKWWQYIATTALDKEM